MAMPVHQGQIYADFLPALIEKRECSQYLEVGVSNGYLLNRIRCETAIGVDPAFDLKFDVTIGKKSIFLYRETSDFYFRHRASGLRPSDFSFLDGMHVFEYLLRDFYNAERHSHKGSLIAMHDCLPPNEEMTERQFSVAFERGKDTKYPSHWTGDVWKIVPILKKYRPDLRLVFIDAPPTGLLFATNLDPSSEVLEKNYLRIVDEFRSLPNDQSAIEQYLYADTEIVSTSSVLSEFDHTLFFTT